MIASAIRSDSKESSRQIELDTSRAHTLTQYPGRTATVDAAFARSSESRQSEQPAGPLAVDEVVLMREEQESMSLRAPEEPPRSVIYTQARIASTVVVDCG